MSSHATMLTGNLNGNQACQHVSTLRLRLRLSARRLRRLLSTLPSVAFSQIQLRPHPYAPQEPHRREVLYSELADTVRDDLLTSGGPKGRNVLTSCRRLRAESEARRA